MPPLTRWYVKTSFLYLILALITELVLILQSTFKWTVPSGLFPVYTPLGHTPALVGGAREVCDGGHSISSAILPYPEGIIKKQIISVWQQRENSYTLRL